MQHNKTKPFQNTKRLKASITLHFPTPYSFSQRKSQSVSVHKFICMYFISVCVRVSICIHIRVYISCYIKYTSRHMHLICTYVHIYVCLCTHKNHPKLNHLKLFSIFKDFTNLYPRNNVVHILTNISY